MQRRGTSTNIEKIDILRDGLAHGVIAGKWGRASKRPCHLVVYTRLSGKGGSREIFVSACSFVSLLSLSLSLALFPPDGIGISLTAKGQLFSLSGLALDTPWYKIKRCKFFSLFFVMQRQIEPCFVSSSCACGIDRKQGLPSVGLPICTGFRPPQRGSNEAPQCPHSGLRPVYVV